MRNLLVVISMTLILSSATMYAITSNAEVCPDNCRADIVILIDRSGSMATEFASGQSKYDVAVNGVIKLLNSTCTDGRFWIGIIEYWFRSDNITYTGSPSNGILFNVSGDTVVEDLISRIESRSSIPPVGISMMGYAIGNATNMLSTGRGEIDDYIVLISDGLTDQDPWEYVIRAKSLGIKIISIFIGNPTIDNDELLENMSDIFINVSDPNINIEDAFVEVYDSICPLKAPVLVGGLIVDDEKASITRAHLETTVIALLTAILAITSIYVRNILRR